MHPYAINNEQGNGAIFNAIHFSRIMPEREHIHYGNYVLQPPDP